MGLLDEVFAELREILKLCELELAVVEDSKTNYYLNCKKPRAKNKDMFFGAVVLRKRYISYHLMPVYVYPELLQNFSPELKKRMHGKSCFNFTQIDKSLLLELANQTLLGLERFRDTDML